MHRFCFITKECEMAKILIVDDSIVMRRNLRIILEEAGHTVVGEANDGQQAYFEYRKTKPDLVTMDITMPKVDGIDALINILENFPNANIVMISALDQKTKVFSALRNGAKHYIIKPITSEKIISVIDKVMEDKFKNDLIIREEQDEVSKPVPFSIENADGIFTVTIMRNLELEDVVKLASSMEGFLMIDHVCIVFEFRTFLIIGEDALTKFDALVHKIKSKNGEFTLKSRSKDLIQRLLEKDKDLDSIILDGMYTLK